MRRQEGAAHYRAALSHTICCHQDSTGNSIRQTENRSKFQSLKLQMGEIFEAADNAGDEKIAYHRQLLSGAGARLNGAAAYGYMVLMTGAAQ